MSFESLQAAAAQHVAADKVPGLAALVAHGEQVHVEALGTLAIGGPPVARDSIVRIASTTKPITAAATLAVVEEGSGCCSRAPPVSRSPTCSGRACSSRWAWPWAGFFSAGRSWGFCQAVYNSGAFGWGLGGRRLPRVHGATRRASAGL